MASVIVGDDGDNLMQPTSILKPEVVPLSPTDAEEARRVFVEGFKDDPVIKVFSSEEKMRKKYINSVASIHYRFSLSPTETFLEIYEPLMIVVKNKEETKNSIVTIAYCNPMPYEGVGVTMTSLYFMMKWFGLNGPKMFFKDRGFLAVLDRLKYFVANYLSIPTSEINDPRRVSELHWLCTMPDHRRKGYGSAALDYIINHYDAKNIPLMLYSSTAKNLPLYRRVGFVDLGCEEWNGALITVCARKVAVTK